MVLFAHALTDHFLPFPQERLDLFNARFFVTVSAVLADGTARLHLYGIKGLVRGRLLPQEADIGLSADDPVKIPL